MIEMRKLPKKLGKLRKLGENWTKSTSCDKKLSKNLVNWEKIRANCAKHRAKMEKTGPTVKIVPKSGQTAKIVPKTGQTAQTGPIIGKLSKLN